MVRFLFPYMIMKRLHLSSYVTPFLVKIALLLTFLGKNIFHPNDSKGIPLEVEHILVYSKKKTWQPSKLPRTEKMDASYKNPDGDRCKWMSGSPIASDAKTHQGMVYAIQHPLTGKLLYPKQYLHIGVIAKNRCWNT